MERKGCRPALALLMALLVALAAAGCGTRQSRTEVEAAARGSSEGTSGASGAGGATVGTAGSDVDVAGGDATAAPGSAIESEGPTSSPTAGGGGQVSADGGGTDGGGGGAANGTPIVIGNVSTTSGISGVPQRPGVRALQAWVAMTNASGGINGHPIELVLADDGADPARHAAAVKDLVENKGVIAFVANWASQTVHASRSYLEEKRIPVVGGDSSTSHWFESPMLFGGSPAPEDFMRARLKALASLTENRKIATIVCRESQVCLEAAAAAKRNAAEFGFEVVYEGQASLAQPDFTAECISARNAGANVILPTFDPASMRRIAQSCDRQSYRPHYDLVPAVEEDFPEVPAFERATISHFTFPTLADAPGAKRFRDTLAQYAPNQPPFPVAGSGWVSATLFGRVAARAFPPDATPSTPALLEALWSVKNDTVDGLSGPLTFVKDQPVGPTAPKCVFTMQIRGGAFMAPNGMEPVCL